MSDIALESQGITIDLGTAGSPPAFANIPEVKSIAGPDGQANWMDTTDLNSTGKEGRPGLKDEGQIRLRLFYVPDNAVHASLRTNYSNRTQCPIRITFTDTAPATIWEADVFVTGFQVAAEVDAPLTAEVTMRITGAIRQVQ